MHGNRAVRGGGYNLSQRLCSDVAYSKDTVNVGFRAFVGDNVTQFIKRKRAVKKGGNRLSANADEKSVTGDF